MNDWSKNTYVEVKNTKTPIDLILHNAATRSQEDFIEWLTIHATDLKQAEINLLADSFFDGITTEPFERLEQTNHYIVTKYKHLPTI